jgi:cystathionine beta-synthase
LTTASLSDPKVLDKTVSDVMDQPFPVVEDDQPVENVAKLLSKSNRAVLLRRDGMVQGIVTRFDVLEYLMHR